MACWGLALAAALASAALDPAPLPPGLGVEPVGCDPTRPSQRWAAQPHRGHGQWQEFSRRAGAGTHRTNVQRPSGGVVVGDDAVAFRPAANVSLCLTAGAGGVIFTVTCGDPPTKQQLWLTRAADSRDVPASGHTGAGAVPLLLESAGSPGQCASVRGCCDGGPLALVPCSKCNASDPSVSPPPDCLVNLTDVGSDGAATIATVASGLCFDAGGALLPPKGCLPGGPAAGLPFCDEGQTPQRRAADLASRLTLAETASAVLSMVMVPTSLADGTPVKHNLRASAGAPRLGVPPLLYNEAMHGIVALCLRNNSCPTSFPVQLAQTASFNRTLWRAVASALGKEGRALFNAGLDAAVYFAPNVDPFRDPRFGRGMETGGEDAWVNSQVAIEYVLGLQGGPAPSSRHLQTLATCKHIEIYDSQSPKDFDANASAHDLHDFYLVPWRACALDAGAASMMASYGTFNGVPDVMHGDMTGPAGLVRAEWNYTGFVVSDCDAVDMYRATRPSMAASAAAALLAGTDLDCGPFYQAHLADAVAQGLVPRSAVDAAAARVLEQHVRLGVFDAATPFSSLGLGEVGSTAHAALAREAAAQSCVLLRNPAAAGGGSAGASASGGAPTPTLPLGRAARLVFAGPHANSTLDLLGNDYMADNKAVLGQSFLAAAHRRGLSVTHAAGCADLACSSGDGIEAAAAAAAAADAAVVFVGISSAFENEGRDRRTLELPGHQLALALRVAAAQPRTAVVLVHGGMVHIDELLAPNITAAVLSASYPGQEGGSGVLDVLLGDASPAGRLPFTWYRRGFAEERPRINDNDLRSGSGITYRYYKGSPLLPFGHGLSYAAFSYSWATPPTASVATTALRGDNAGVPAMVRVRNTGRVDSETVVLAFVSTVPTLPGCPLRTLAAFERVFVAAGAAVDVPLRLPAREVACVNEAGERTLRAASVRVSAGDVEGPAMASISLTGPEVMLDP